MPTQIIKPDKDAEIKRLKEEKEILIKVVVRHKPEMEGWINKNFRKGNER